MERFEGFERRRQLGRAPRVSGRALTERVLDALDGSPVVLVALLGPEGNVLEANRFAIDGWGLDRSAIAVTAVEISDLLRAQIERQRELAADAAETRGAGQRLRSGLDAMIDNVTIARAVRDPSGAIVDFVIEFANRASADGAGRTADELVDNLVCELYPGWRESGLFDRFRDVVESGIPYVVHRLPYFDELPDGTRIEGFWDIQVSRLDDGYIAASRDATELVRTEEAARAAAMSEARERFALETLQRAALSVELPSVAGVDIGVMYQPAASDVPLGGDWYDVVALPDGQLTFIIADVAGHGATTAGSMVQLRNMLRTLAVEHVTPSEVLARANEILRVLSGGVDSFATCSVAVLDPVTRSLRWALAGRLPPLRLSPDSTGFLFVAPGPPLGAAPEATYTDCSAHLAVGDRLVFYTDGLVERRGSSLDVDLERLRHSAVTSRSMAPPNAARWLASTLPAGDDDVALIVADLRDG